MRANPVYNNSGGTSSWKIPDVPRRLVIGVIFIVALCAFEMFNFDTTEYALESLLGQASFVGLRWATILAIAFCAIDFAGLARIFTPEKGDNEPKEVWYLTGAWLLGATMNAVMTWWAVSLTLLTHDFGNEVLSREQLLRIVPIFVAVLVWLTRILFIGSMAVAGDHLFNSGSRKAASGRQLAAPAPKRQLSTPRSAAPLKPASASYSGTRRTSRPQSPPQRPAAMTMRGQNSRSRHLD